MTRRRRRKLAAELTTVMNRLRESNHNQYCRLRHKMRQMVEARSRYLARLQQEAP